MKEELNLTEFFTLLAKTIKSKALQLLIFSILGSGFGALFFKLNAPTFETDGVFSTSLMPEEEIPFLSKHIENDLRQKFGGHEEVLVKVAETDALVKSKKSDFEKQVIFSINITTQLKDKIPQYTEEVLTYVGGLEFYQKKLATKRKIYEESLSHLNEALEIHMKKPGEKIENQFVFGSSENLILKLGQTQEQIENLHVIESIAPFRNSSNRLEDIKVYIVIGMLISVVLSSIIIWLIKV